MRTLRKGLQIEALAVKGANARKQIVAMMLVILVSCIGLVTSPIRATAQEMPVWGLTALGDVCRIQFTGTKLQKGLGGVVHLDTGCRIGRIYGFSRPSDDAVILYSAPNTPIARLDRQYNGAWVGLYGDGDSIEMSVLASAPNTNTQHCITYANRNTCASSYDLTSPVASGQKLPLQPVVRLNLRATPSLVSSIHTTVPTNVCVEVTHCDSANFDDQLWCHVKMGSYTGWILKKDPKHVYAQNGCG